MPLNRLPMEGGAHSTGRQRRDPFSGRATQFGVNLGGGGWPGHFHAGGEIYRVRRGYRTGGVCASPMG
jgi:hypothetical protein